MNTIVIPDACTMTIVGEGLTTHPDSWTGATALIYVGKIPGDDIDTKAYAILGALRSAGRRFPMEQWSDGPGLPFTHAPSVDIFGDDSTGLIVITQRGGLDV